MSEPLWTLEELTEATGGRVIGNPPGKYLGISIDSRTTSPGDIFVAIRGEKHNGHDFAAAALKAGAGLAIVSRHDEAMVSAGCLLLVDDPLKALEQLAVAARARSSARIIAVTGSVGKTGTKEALRLCLSATAETHASAASFNNHWGVPISLARMPRSARFGIFEIGMNHAGEITPLVGMVRPHLAIITSIAPVHLGHLGSMEAIADAKAEIFTGLEPNGIAILGDDNNPQSERLVAAAQKAGIGRTVLFGEGENADARARHISLREDCSVVLADILGDTLTYRIGAPGRHIAVNSLAVLAAVRLAGADLALGALKLLDLRPPVGRGARFKLQIGPGELTVIDESYNANPVSMRAALMLLGQTSKGRRGRRIAVLGDMLELGSDAEKFHAGLDEAINAATIDLVYACGPRMRALWDRLTPDQRGAYATTSEELVHQLIDDLRVGDVVMVKGSLGSRMGVFIEALRENFAAIKTDAA